MTSVGCSDLVRRIRLEEPIAISVSLDLRCD